MSSETDASSSSPSTVAAEGATDRAMDRRTSVLSVVFRAGTERLALPARDIYKVVTVAPMCRLPRLSPVVAGITHHRGRIVTVIDAVPLLFDRRSSPGGDRGPDARILVLDRAHRHVALLVDAVLGIEPMRPARELPTGPRPALRVGEHAGRAVLVIDTAALVDLVLHLAG